MPARLRAKRGLVCRAVLGDRVSLRGADLHYTPDFHVLRARRNELVECKPDDLADTDENQRKFAAAVAWCAQQDFTFQIITDRQLRAGCYLKNVKLLTYHARHTIRPEAKARVFAVLETAEPLTVADVGRVLSPDNPPAAWATILHMAFHHEVSISLDSTPVTMACPIALPGRAPKELRA